MTISAIDRNIAVSCAGDAVHPRATGAIAAALGPPADPWPPLAIPRLSISDGA